MPIPIHQKRQYARSKRENISESNRDEGYYMKLLDKWRKTTVANQLMVYTTAIVAVGTIFYTIVAVFQWQLMKESGKQTSVQVDKLIDQSKRIADTSDETAHQAKVALDTTIENARLEQRAWIGITSMYSNDYSQGNKIFIEGKMSRIGVFVINSGKTPARNFRGFAYSQYLKAGEKPVLPKKESQRVLQGSSGVVQPNMSLAIGTQTDITPNKAYIDNLTSGKSVFFVLGVVTYDDVFGRHHFTKFCNFLSPDLIAFSACPTGNETDDK